MNKLLGLGLSAMIGLTAFTGAAMADEYIRKDDQIIDVVIKDGQLFCTRRSDGYEMCNGMTKQDDGTWQGKNMRHPDMPKFMKFKGTVTFGSNGLKIKGCALGMCDEEVWLLP